MFEKEEYEKTLPDGTTRKYYRLKLHRGDVGTIAYSIELADESNYVFQPGDIVKFTVFEKKGYDKIPVISKTITIHQEATEVLIDLVANDTLNIEPINKPITYWYEITLNGNLTTNGYDEDEGALEFVLLPGKEIENE